MHQTALAQFSKINLAQALDINIFERDYSNLNNPIPSKDINLQYTRFIVENRDNIWCNKKEGFFWHDIFQTNIVPRISFDLVPKEFFAPKGPFSIKGYSSEAR